jgi:hypothetical protein
MYQCMVNYSKDSSTVRQEPCDSLDVHPFPSLWTRSLKSSSEREKERNPTSWARRQMYYILLTLRKQLLAFYSSVNALAPYFRRIISTYPTAEVSPGFNLTLELEANSSGQKRRRIRGGSLKTVARFPMFRKSESRPRPCSAIGDYCRCFHLDAYIGGRSEPKRR